MNKVEERIRRQFDFEVQAFRFLVDMGFDLSYQSDVDGSRLATYVSKIFGFRIGMSFNSDENFREFLDVRTNKKLIYPTAALAYFFK